MYTGYAADFRQIVRAIASFISIYSNVSESAAASSQSLTTKKVARRSSHARLSLPSLCESSPQGKLNDSVQPGNVQLRSSSRSQLLVLFILQMFSGSGAVQGKCYRFAARPGTKPFSVGGAAAAAEAEAYSQTSRESLYLSRVVPRQPISLSEAVQQTNWGECVRRVTSREQIHHFRARVTSTCPGLSTHGSHNDTLAPGQLPRHLRTARGLGLTIRWPAKRT
jgi:hypothetical protein